jgi:uncharacterized protein (TIGR02145 family)
MKNFNLIALSLFLVLNLHAQDIEITFTGSGAATTVEDVKVVYLSKGDSIDISGTDVLKLVVSSTGIHSSMSDDNGLKVYPNPMKEESRIQFQTGARGPVSVELFDITGKLVVSSRQELESGAQTFSLSGVPSGLYTLRASAPGQTFTSRIIAARKNTGIPSLRHESSEYVSRNPGSLKTGQAERVLNYTSGDWILLKGKSGNYQRVVMIAPTQSQVVNFSFVACTDGDGNHYPVITIGTQTWMAENLNTAKFNDGTDIMNIVPDALWTVAQIPGWAWVNNDEQNYGMHGRLYNWFVIGGEKNPCPTGWHAPSLEEYNVFKLYTHDNYGWPGRVMDASIGWAGKALAHITLWDEWLTRTPAIGNGLLANNATGFSIIPTGGRRADGTFSNPKQWAYFWLATESEADATKAHDFLLRWDFGRNENYTEVKQRGMAVRCLKD